MTNTCIKKVFVLKGKRDTGKTQKLKNLIHLFMSYPRSCVIQSAKNNNDILVAFSYKGVQIGIATGGDNKKDLELNFKFFENQECAIVITAWSVYRNSSASKFYNSSKQYKLKDIIKYKPASDEFEKANLDQAKIIYSKVEKFISQIKY